jgi:hypothetical protein
VTACERQCRGRWHGGDLYHIWASSPSDPYEASHTDGVANATFTAGSDLGTATVHVEVDALEKDYDITIDLGFHMWLPWIMRLAR